MHIITTPLGVAIEKQCGLVDTIDHAIGGDVFFSAPQVGKGRIEVGYVNNVTANRTGRQPQPRGMG